MELLEGIYSRRSVREYTGEPVDRDDLLEIVKAGSWAPSGLNNQPWRFVIVEDRRKLDALAGLTKYRRILEDCSAAIVLFADTAAMYNETKDYMALGACAQNMLLAAHALGLGTVWIGEILNREDRVKELLGVPPGLKLTALIALGHPARRNQSSQRRPLSELILDQSLERK